MNRLLVVLLCWVSVLCADVTSQYGNAFRVPIASVGAPSSAGTDTITLKVKHRQSKQLADYLSGLYSGVTCAGESQWKVITCIGSDQDLLQVKQAARRLDTPQVQFEIDVQVIETSTQNMRQIEPLLVGVGTQLNVDLSLKTGKLSSVDQLRNILKVMVSEGEARLVAKPTLTTLDNHEAAIRVGDRIPYVVTLIRRDREVQEVRHLDTGVELKLTPTLLANGRAQIDIFSRVSEIKLWMEFATGSFPVVSNRQAEAQVELALGETLLLAGLLNEREVSSVRRVPVLSRIPLLGRLFRSVSKEKMASDVIFVITPRLSQARS